MTTIRRLLIASSIFVFAVSACRTPDSKSRLLTVSSPDGKLAVSLAVKTLPQPISR